MTRYVRFRRPPTRTLKLKRGVPLRVNVRLRGASETLPVNRSLIDIAVWDRN